MKKFVLILAIVATIAAFFMFDGQQYLSIDYLKSSQAQFSELKAQNYMLVAGGFFVLYVAVTALSLPGAVILTLAAGALFGLWEGLLLASFASSIGATLAFLVSRFLLQNSIQQKFGSRLISINEGMEKDGAFYLFTLRLVPLFPFFMINLVMGLTKIKIRTFYWVSQLGMLAGTFVFVNAGTQLAQLEDVSGILSPKLLLSFALLGIFPLFAKWIVSIIKIRKVYSQYKKPKNFDRNLVVIGAGAAGLVSSYIAAAVKAKVTLVEASKMGGDCLNYGCVPSKALIKSASLAHQMQHGKKYGLSNEKPHISFKKIFARMFDIIAAIEPHDSVERYTNLGVDVVEGYAKIIDPWTVEIKKNGGESYRLTARSIIIAAGAAPFIPDIPGLNDIDYVTSDTLWETFAKLEMPPKKLVVLGGGPIGCELAQSFARLNIAVTQVDRGSRLLKVEDEDVSEIVEQTLAKSGVNILKNYHTVRCEKKAGKNILVLEHKQTHMEKNEEANEEANKVGVEIEVECDYLILAVGRKARLTGYGLENLGIEISRTVSTVDTDAYLATLYPNIFAAGDVAGPYQFTHVAAHQAWYASVNALFGQFKKFKADYSVIPWATFVDPEVARVGLSEQEANAQNITYDVTKYGIDDLDRAITDSADHGFVKVLTVPGKDKILGVTIVGVHAGDLLAEYVLAMKHGLGLNKILGTIHTYPTLAEANKYAAGEWKRANQPEKLLAWIEKYHRWRRG